MEKINIHSANSQIHLHALRYYVDVVGGFNVETNGFRLTLVHKETGEIVKPTKTQWPVQSIHVSKRSKRCFEFDIITPGPYTIEFSNSDKLLVKRSNLILALLFSKPIPNDQLAVYIYRDN